MPRSPDQTLIYHITDVTNLTGILKSGGLLSDVAMAQSGLANINIGHNHIKQRRMTQYRVPCADNRFVGEFVPFYYCPRSPMLYTVNMGNTGRPKGCQATIVHLVSTVAHALALNRPWAISDMNAGSALAEFSSNIATLDVLDWTAIQADYWRECAMPKAAEFLVADHFEWSAVQSIGCYDAGSSQRVSELLQTHHHKPAISVQRNWYY